MISQLLKTVLIILILTPLLSSANTNITWQKMNSSTTDNVSIGHGAFISKQKQSLLISAGITGGNAPFIAENSLNLLTAQANPPLNFQVITDNNASALTLSEKHGNRAFAASVNYNNATIIVGGISNKQASSLVNVIILADDEQKISSYPLPSLPHTALSPSGVIIGNTLFVLTGGDANNRFYSLDLTGLTDENQKLTLNQYNNPSWIELAALPLASTENNYQNGRKLIVQNDGTGEKIFALGGYEISNFQVKNDVDLSIKQISPITEMWKFDPYAQAKKPQWLPLGHIVVAKKILNQRINTLSPLGQSHILALTNQGKALSFNAITKSWTQYQQLLIDEKITNTRPLISESIRLFDKSFISLNQSTHSTGSLELWQVEVQPVKKDFGWVNMTVLVIYLICVVLVGLFFMFKNKNTDDYFRGGQSIPWWAAACSIYATMLSSLTYVALPAVVYQSNWLLLIGIWMIIVVAPIAVYIAMPFFRQINATSAYEYLSKRFNMSVRLFASGLFTLFHISRMGIVMAITALAMSAVTPLSPSDSVLIMGVLCLIYCTMGGIEAVIWTDTLQTIVLLLGAVICFVTIVIGLDGGLTDFITVGFNDNKFTMVNNDFSASSITTLSIWVIVLGGIGQNLSSYTADQSIVQRYMVTEDPKAAAKSIWANAVMAAPGALLFFCIGTGLYVFYQTHPEKIDPTMQLDQIFPLFIANELPIGLAGLIVAGIFAAAQSTVSTSMNSTATTLVTDFIKPFNLVKTENGYLNAARWLTFIMGVLGTIAGLIFINPEIRSLMAAYFQVIGMFMGCLGGLFVLGALTKKANSTGAIIGIVSGVAIMVSAWQMGWASYYLYATIGIVSCLVIGYIASLLCQGNEQSSKDLTGLTLYTMQTSANKS
jgi:SSS family transporter